MIFRVVHVIVTATIFWRVLNVSRKNFHTKLKKRDNKDFPIST